MSHNINLWNSAVLAFGLTKLSFYCLLIIVNTCSLEKSQKKPLVLENEGLLLVCLISLFALLTDNVLIKCLAEAQVN